MIYLDLPSLPLSVNHAYVNKRGGRGRFLSKEGTAYKMSVKTTILQKYPQALRFFDQAVNKPLGLYLKLTFLTITNLGYPTQTDSRYKRVDVTNRVKLFEDALKDVANIDDSQNMMVCLHKTDGPEERTQCWVWNLLEEPSPFDEFYKLNE